MHVSPLDLGLFCASLAMGNGLAEMWKDAKKRKTEADAVQSNRRAWRQTCAAWIGYQ